MHTSLPLSRLAILLALFTFAVSGSTADAKGLNRAASPRTATAANAKKVELAKFQVRTSRNQEVSARLVGTPSSKSASAGSPQFTRLRVELDRPVGVFRRTSFPVAVSAIKKALTQPGAFKLESTASYSYWGLGLVSTWLGKMGMVRAVAYTSKPVLSGASGHEYKTDFHLINPSEGGGWHYKVPYIFASAPR